MERNTKLNTVTIEDVYKAVQKFTMDADRYNSGWDVICECYGKRELQDTIDDHECETFDDLLKALADRAGLFHERCMDAQAAGGQDVIEHYGTYVDGPLKPTVD